MNKIVYLLSHVPNPRIIKRVKTLKYEFEQTIIYWDRGQNDSETFEKDVAINISKVIVEAPIGDPVRRIIPLFKFSKEAIKQLRNHQPDIVHAANFDMLIVAIIYKRKYNRKLKIVYEVADLREYALVKKVVSLKTLVYRMLQVIEKRMVTQVTLLIITSPSFWDRYYSKIMSKDKCIFVPNMPYSDTFSSFERKKTGDFTIGFIGSVRYFNQIKLLIDVVHSINSESKHKIRIMISGSGPDLDAVKSYASSHNFVEVTGPYNYEKEIANLYSKIDLTYAVYDNNNENVRLALPNRLYESIICGIPIVAAGSTLLGSIILNKKIGFTIEPNDEADLKKLLINYLENEELRKQTKDNILKYQEENTYENYSELLKQRYLYLKN